MSGFITQVEVEANRELIVDMWGESFYDFLQTCDCPTFLDALTQFGIL